MLVGSFWAVTITGGSVTRGCAGALWARTGEAAATATSTAAATQPALAGDGNGIPHYAAPGPSGKDTAGVVRDECAMTAQSDTMTERSVQ
jgi:hypothetical protein